MLDPRTRSFLPRYQTGMTCPGCLGKHWHVGRMLSECARCGTALPLERGRVEFVKEAA